MKDINDVKLFLLDLDGTVYLGENEIKGAFDTVNTLREMGKKVCFLTNNSSNSQEAYIEKLAKLGLTISKDEIYTSGMAASEFILSKYKDKSVFLLGTDTLKEEVKSYGIKLDTYDKADIALLGFDTTLTYDNLYKFCLMLQSGKDYIATHPDNVCPAPLGDMPDVGSFIKMIEVATKRLPDYICGKPYSIMANCIKDRFNLDAEEIAMVGDRLYTDTAFGINNGFYSILVLSGETDMKMLKESKMEPDLVLDDITGIVAKLNK